MEDNVLISSFYIRNLYLCFILLRSFYSYLCFIFELTADDKPSVAYRGTSEGTEPATVPMQLIPLTTNGNDVTKSRNSHDDIDDEDSPQTKKQYVRYTKIFYSSHKN